MVIINHGKTEDSIQLSAILPILVDITCAFRTATLRNLCHRRDLQSAATVTTAYCVGGRGAVDVPRAQVRRCVLRSWLDKSFCFCAVLQTRLGPWV